MAIDVLDEWESGDGALGNVSLEQKLAARIGLSRDRLQALFARWAGGDLSRFVQALGVSHTRKRLLETRALLLAACRWPDILQAGSPQATEGGLRVRLLPTEQGKGQSKGAGKGGEAKTSGLTITYGCYPSPFGECFLAMAGQEICSLSFVDGREWQSHRDELAHCWPQATIIADEGEDGRQIMARIFTRSGGADSRQPLRLLLQGTLFQIRVWQALLALPRGTLISYQDLAVYIGHPNACRAVAGAVAANPVAWLVPCHRVIRKSGEIHQYRWGRSRKKAMLGWEACQL